MRRKMLPPMPVSSEPSRCGTSTGCDAIAIWEKALQSLDLRKVVDDYIGIGRVPREKVLVIVLRREEGSARLDDGDDRDVEHMRIVELGESYAGNWVTG